MIATNSSDQTYRSASGTIRTCAGESPLSGLLVGLLIVIVIIVLLLSQEDLEVGMAL